ncbi:MAG: YkgJ family cysteine cluster protein [Algoriphagus sp.]|uniref:YkgJ family cysteine cluster protein n=1 Tax=Algoriphagus sp. TaxID=1872435 RepID=UPI00273017E0|nr:YkgJ family cysteine cluster protein [Algoriphagus sp.]MDP2041470.1 YkgJ family cysteine cluster protein [Algoriphagus sp.]MDP3471024.1 YkgJ family cysteine cluster protein [Algoriphagus sp.]
MKVDLEKFSRESKSDFLGNKKLKEKLKNTKPKNLDSIFLQHHEDAFSEINCLDCANCCKTTSPIFIQTDIDRLAKVFRMKSSQFIDEYLHRDEESDYVLNTSPCPFLGLDNKCLVYEDRPKACREYPHTNRKNMLGILELSLKNTLVCPAVFKIFYEIGKDYRK